MGNYNFYLMPIAFESTSGVIETLFKDDKSSAMANLAKLISERQVEFPFDPTRAFNLSVQLEIQFVKKAGIHAIPVKVDGSHPNALPVTVSEEDSLGAYPWRPKDLRGALRKRYSDFKENKKFFQILRPLEAKKAYARPVFWILETQKARSKSVTTRTSYRNLIPIIQRRN